MGVVVALGTAISAHAQSGQALDWYTREPVAGAHMELDCEGAPLLKLEGHVHLFTMARTTDGEGRYSFSLADHIVCSKVILNGQKEGFSLSFPSSGDEASRRPVPTIEYFVKTSDAVYFELEHITPSPGVQVRHLDGSADAAGIYRYWFAAFFEAKRIATSQREIEFVHQHYCKKLADLYAALSDTEKASIVKFAVEYNYGGKLESAKTMDHGAEVVAYCTNP